MKKLGTHLLIDITGCDAEKLDDERYIRCLLNSAAMKANATIIGEIFHKFSPVGVSGILAISESHISIHTWPEMNTAIVDILTCSDTCDPYLAANYIAEGLNGNMHITEMARGIN